MGEAPEHIVLIENEEDVDALEVARSRRRSPSSRRRRSRSMRPRAIIAALRERFPAIVGPRTDDICYATTNRQAAVKQLARECELVLVIGSRNSSNSNRLVEVAREHGAESHLIDNETEVREEWLAGKRVVGITSGASAPEELVDALVDFFRARGTDDVSPSWRSSSEDVRFMLPKPIRQAAAARPDPRRARRCARSSSPTCTSARAAAAACCSIRSRWRRCPSAPPGADRLVLLGDIVELRQGPVRDALAAASRVLADLAQALAPGAEVVIVPGNHDHHLLDGWLARRAASRPPPPLGLDAR